MGVKDQEPTVNSIQETAQIGEPAKQVSETVKQEEQHQPNHDEIVQNIHNFNQK